MISFPVKILCVELEFKFDKNPLILQTSVSTKIDGEYQYCTPWGLTLGWGSWGRSAFVREGRKFIEFTRLEGR